MLAAPFYLDPVLLGSGAVPLIFLIGVTVGRWLKRRRGVRIGLLYQLFCLSLALWLPLIFVRPPVSWREAAITHLGAATAVLGTLFLIALIRRFFWEGWFQRKNQLQAPKFLSELVALALFIIALLLVFGGIYHKSIEGAVFGSTVVLGVIGFAMQDLLGNIIAGVALEIGKPFKPGDWLLVEGRHAEVVEVNWRSTRLRNNDAVHFDIPNKHIVGTTIVNLTYAAREHALRMIVSFDHATPPNAVKDSLLRAASSARGVLASPEPRAFLKDFAESSVQYEIKFWIEDEATLNETTDCIRTNIWYEAQRAGLRMPFPIRTLHLERPKARAASSLDAARSSAREHPFLQLLDEAQIDTLLTPARMLRFGRGEHIIEQGADGHSMFILLRGEAEVLVTVGETLSSVAVLRAGDYFGEMSLMTGEPRSATIRAQSDCELWEIQKEIFAGLLQQNGPLVEKLSDLLAKRRLENEGHVAHAQQTADSDERHGEYRASFLSKVTKFFEL